MLDHPLTETNGSCFIRQTRNGSVTLENLLGPIDDRDDVRELEATCRLVNRWDTLYRARQPAS